MASIWEDIWDGVTDYVSGGKKSSREYEEAITKASDEYGKESTAANEAYTNAKNEANTAYSQSVDDINKYLDEAGKTAASMRKDTKQIQQEGKETAAAEAGNKAGIAKRNAKAASMMANGSKLMAAIQGAQGAVDASTEGYDNAAARNANLSASQNQADIQNYMNLVGNKANVMSDKAKNTFNTSMANAENTYNTAVNNAANKYNAATGAAQQAQQNAADSRNRKASTVNTLLASWLK